MSKKATKPYIIKSTTNKGLCLFASRDIKKGENLGYYSGAHFPEMGEQSVYNLIGYTTLAQFGEDITIDPEDPEFGSDLCRGSYSHNPNCEFEEDKFGMPFIQSMRAIKKGEEITYDYGIELPPTPYLRKKWKCLCGEKNCYGDMLAWCEDTPPEIERDFNVTVEEAMYLIKFLLRHGARNRMQQRMMRRVAKDDLQWMPKNLHAQVRQWAKLPDLDKLVK